MCSKIERDFLTIFQFVINAGANVVRDFIETNIKASFQTFELYLVNKKHYFYHQLDPRLYCCECKPHGCSKKQCRKFNMNRQLFQKMYSEITSLYDKKHEVYNKGQKETICICGYVQNKIDISHLDLSDLYFILQTLNIPQKQKDSIQTIVDIRNKLSHSISSEAFGETDLELLWDNIKDAMASISSNCSPRFLTGIIEDSKRKILMEEEVKDLKDTVHKCLQENSEIRKDGERITNHIKDLDTMACSKFSELITDSKDSRKQLNRLEENVENVRHLILEFTKDKKTVRVEHVECQTCVCETLHIVESQSKMTQTEAIKEPNAHMKIDGLQHSEEIRLLENSNTKDNNDNVETEPVVEILDGRIGSVILDLKISSSAFNSPNTLRSAIQSAVETILHKGDVDTSVEGTIKIQLTFVNSLSSNQKETVTKLLSMPTMFQGAAILDTPIYQEDSRTKQPSRKNSDEKEQSIQEIKEENRKLYEENHYLKNENERLKRENVRREDAGFLSKLWGRFTTLLGFGVNAQEDIVQSQQNIEESDKEKPFWHEEISDSRTKQPSRENSGEKVQSMQEMEEGNRKLYEENQYLKKENECFIQDSRTKQPSRENSGGKVQSIQEMKEENRKLYEENQYLKHENQRLIRGNLTENVTLQDLLPLSTGMVRLGDWRTDIKAVSYRSDVVILGFDGEENEIEEVKRFVQTVLNIENLKVEYFKKRGDDEFVKRLGFVIQLSHVYRLIFVYGGSTNVTEMRHLRKKLGSDYKHKVIMITKDTDYERGFLRNFFGLSLPYPMAIAEVGFDHDAFQPFKVF